MVISCTTRGEASLVRKKEDSGLDGSGIKESMALSSTDVRVGKKSGREKGETSELNRGWSVK